jgi:hypothetical protein
MARADMHTHLTKATAQGPGVAEVTQAGRFQPRQDSGFALASRSPPNHLAKVSVCLKRYTTVPYPFGYSCQVAMEAGSSTARTASGSTERTKIVRRQPP